jgi:hypothetical protein
VNGEIECYVGIKFQQEMEVFGASYYDWIDANQLNIDTFCNEIDTSIIHNVNSIQHTSFFCIDPFTHLEIQF